MFQLPGLALPQSTQPAGLSRRRLLQIGGLGAFGLDLPGWLARRAAAGTPNQPLGGDVSGRAAPNRPRIDACILVFFYGGPSQLETWDPKPDAPREVRGEFAPIETSAPGVQIGEHLPRMARQMHRVCLVRSMHHPMRNHNAAAVEALCGRTPLGGDQELLADDALSFPCYGSALHYLTRDSGRELATVALPHMMYNVVRLPGQTAGFLGPQYNPFHVQADPTAESFRVGELELPAGVSGSRLSDRRALLKLVDSQLADAERALATRSVSTYYQKAFDLLRSENVRRGFDLAQEPAATRERYGRNTLGQSLLLSRRLVEAGVPFVSVYDKVHNGQEANWDSHASVFPRHRDHLIPPADQGLSALIEDLAERGMLERTLVIALGEFGRTPKINASAGRDHWPDVFSVMLAGGGVRGGFVYGASDRLAAYPDRDGVSPGDLSATLFHAFGCDPQTVVHDPAGRPFHIADGREMNEWFA